MKSNHTIIITDPHKKILTSLPSNLKNYNILFAGEWCFEKSYFSKVKNFQITSNPFENKKEKKKNFYIIKKSYNFLLIDLTNYLNQIHKVNYSKNYWEQIIGMWLFDFLTIVLEKYLIVKKFKNLPNTSVYKINNNKNLHSDNSREASILLNSHIWNNKIFCFFIKKLKNKIQFKSILVNKNQNISVEKKISFEKVKIYILKIFSIITMRLKKKNEIFIINPYLKLFDELLLQFKVNGLIKINRTSIFTSKIKYNKKIRDIYKVSKNNNKFINLISPILVKNMPKTFIEDYKNILKFSNNLSWPKKPQKIFTSVSNFYDDVFKIWCAEVKRKNFTKLLFCCHGGGFQTNRFSNEKEYLLNTCEKILTWGKNKNKNKKIVSFFNIKSSSKPFQIVNKNSLHSSNILLVQDMPRLYTSFLDSSFLHLSEYKKAVKTQSQFIQKLNPEKRKKVLVRLGSSVLSHSKNNLIEYEKRIWQKQIKDLRIETREKQASISIKNSHVVIITQISSTLLLECVSSSIPFLIFADLKTQIVNVEFKKELYILMENNIMFDDPEKISFFLNKKSQEKLLIWWRSKKIQKIIKNFENKYSRYNPNILNNLKEILISQH